MDKISSFTDFYDDARTWSMVFENRARGEQFAPRESRTAAGPRMADGRFTFYNRAAHGRARRAHEAMGRHPAHRGCTGPDEHFARAPR